MSDQKLNHQAERRARRPFETLDDWENEGGSLCEAALANPSWNDPGAGFSATNVALLEALPLGILITNRDGEITYSNPASQKLYAATASELLGASWRQGIDPRDQAAVDARWQGGEKDSSPGKFEVRMVTGSGRRIWTRHSIASLGPEGAPGDHIHIIEDISRIRAAERARNATLDVLSRERERARVTLECIGDAVISTNARGQVTYLNNVAEHLTGWTREKAEGQPLSRVFRVVDADTGKVISNPAELAMESLEIVQMPANSLLLRPDGSEMAIEDSAAPILDQSGRLTGAVVIFRDQRLSRENTTRMAHLARHDALTGLPNRVAFAEHFDQAIRLARRHNKRVALLFIDLDQFKQINDSLGHKAGDRLLRDVARNLTACVRSTDLVCRHGGDEFVVLLSEIKEPADASRVAIKMQMAASRPRQILGSPICLELSVGISLYPDDGADMDTLIHQADTAMYHAKLDAEKGYCFYHVGMQPRSPELANVTRHAGNHDVVRR
ncbi:diguanylate cyclase domain-containing protein [Wenzhouxiangella sp. EGI_FJ10305]|uniref:diguanylate cyclase domain-containing protein n=1 Tax=Wenzhouxiangella sp. EGI_FJ10305 TaxID=3243768 RepID=UPI0035DF547E